jgi:hypothetical protein
MEKMIAVALEDFEVAVSELIDEVDGRETLRETRLEVIDPETGLLIVAIPLDRKPSESEIEKAVEAFLSKRTELLTLA